MTSPDQSPTPVVLRERDPTARRFSYPLGSGQAEELALSAGLKPVVRQLLRPHEMDAALARIARARLAVRVADKRYLRRGSILFDTDDPSGVTPVFFGRDAGRVEAAAAAELETSGDEGTRELGRLLGYPRCCVEAFLDVPVPRTNLEVARAALARTAGTPLPRLNALDFGVFHYLPWSPCSFDCEPSARYADAVAERVDRFDGAFRRAIDGALASRRWMLDDDVQVSLRAVGSTLEAWPTAIDRHPSSVLSDAAAARVSSLLRELELQGDAALARGGGLVVPFRESS